MNELLEPLRRAARVAIVSHRDPDPDTIGAGLALGLALENAGKSVSFHCADPVPDQAVWLEGSARYTRMPPAGDVDLIVTVDFGDPSRAKLALPAGVPMANIDHHASTGRYGDHQWVDATASATCEMVVRLVDALALPWSPGAATAALCGIMTDTGSLQFPATDGRTYRSAARAREEGADLQAITYNVFRNARFESLRMIGAACARMRREMGGQLVWSEITRHDVADADAREEDVSGVIGTLAQSNGARLAILFTEQDGAVKISARTSAWPPSVDAAALMGRFGGGGHVRAAGARASG
ncbi:MAG: hypothetical protein FJ034_09025, partial [Chloroflexi bacterium]|nr:hypothetical protein [Chloroflexota bacterium]